MPPAPPVPQQQQQQQQQQMMAGSMNWEPVRKRLLGSDLQDGLQAATELRENIEIVHSQQFPLLLSALLPSFSSVLAHGTKPSPDTSSVEHRFRHTILDIITKFPSNEVLRPHAPHLVALAIDILNRDYEENALLASRIIFDLYKVYRALPQDYVQPYVDFVLNCYRSLPVAIQRNFTLPAATVDAAKAAATASETAKPATAFASPGSVDSSSTAGGTKLLSLRANVSFRVLTECPLMVMLMFQLYPKYVNKNIPGLIRVMLEALALRAPRLQSTTLDATSKRLYFSRTRELVAAQAKTLSFLTYLLRSFSSELKAYEDRLASNVVALMSVCPRESVATRRELLVATRHLLNSEFRKGFFKHVDAMLDERVLIGTGVTVISDPAMLRPLGYTTLSDLVQHVRSTLTMTQMSRVVTIFARVLHDNSMTLPMSTQYIAVRTLLSVVDVIYHNKDPNPQLGRDMLVRALASMVSKLSSLCETFSVEDGKAINRTSQLVLGNIAPTHSVRDVQSMIRAIIVGHKTIIYYLNNYRNQRDKGDKKDSRPTIPPGSNEEVSSAMLKLTHTEVQLIDQYLSTVFQAIKKLTLPDPNHTPLATEKTLLEQHRDALTYFASAFTTMDGFSLRRTLGKRLDSLYDAIVDDPAVMIVPRHLLAANATTSYEFCSILLEFLLDRVDDMRTYQDQKVVFLSPGGDQSKDCVRTALENAVKGPPKEESDLAKRASTLLQLFERVLKSLAVFPENETVVRRHLRSIVSICLRNSMENLDAWPDNYCMLLRYVFRSISAGKFEESYRELLPLIPTVLNGLYRIITVSRDQPVLLHTSIELCLTIPARLSSLLPHLNLLLRITIPSLESNSGDLVNLGLRTLEFWVDNLNPLFLYPEISKEKELFASLMTALSRHLRPAPYPYGLLTLRLLGKLGGKNREFIREPMDISQGPERIETTWSIQCRWNKAEGLLTSSSTPVDVPMPLGRCLRLLLRVTEAEAAGCAPEDGAELNVDASVKTWNQSQELWECKMDEVDFTSYSTSVSDDVIDSQVRACFTLAQKALLCHFDGDLKGAPTRSFSKEARSTIMTSLVCVMLSGMTKSLRDEARGTLKQLAPMVVATGMHSSLSNFISMAPQKSESVAIDFLSEIVDLKDDVLPLKKEQILSDLLSDLCDCYASAPLSRHTAFQEAVLYLVNAMDIALLRSCELRIVNSVFVALKSVPRELSRIAIDASSFAIRMCGKLYRSGQAATAKDEDIVWDCLQVDPSARPTAKTEPESSKEKENRFRPSDDSFKIFLQELGCMQQLVRYTARFVFVEYILDASSAEENRAFVAERISIIRRVFFSRSLRLMPLPQQVGVVDGLAVLVKCIPKLFPLSDQHLLAFLSELLKMSSVADGEMTDDSLSGCVVDKNGFVGSKTDPNKHLKPSHASALFNRRICVVDIEGEKMAVPDECPVGVQLRVSSIILFHAVIREFMDHFFDAEASTPIGNIRPHVVSLLFRSLVSFPLQAVNASHVALRDVLSLSVVTKKSEAGEKSQPRLPKELLQTCIRPVLLHLRDYTRLSIPLLRGLSRLLALLSSWFNKTLGEKLLDHLQKWTEPSRILGHKVWKQGTEPLVASAIVEIFALLPHSSHFVEPLVKTCIKLEAALPAFKMRCVVSPYRQPLAKYLNKHPQYTVNFFFQRLKTPMYSELFQSLVQHPDSADLRDHLRSKQSSAMALNVCFERPLAIIRTEKSAPTGSSKTSLATHGIVKSTGALEQTGMAIDSLEIQLQGFRLVEALLSFDPNYFQDHNDVVRAFRWLWRSKGRYLRLQHEDLVSPRFHGESAMLARFLMAHAKSSPNEDMDVLFEMIRIFLQPSTQDAMKIGHFLASTVSNVLTTAQQRQVVHRFFALLAGESTEETKVLSIQFLILPMLRKSSTTNEPKKTKEDMDTDSDTSIIDPGMIEKFSREAISRQGVPPNCGPRLKAELMKLMKAFVDRRPSYVEPHRKELAHFCSALLKSEDAMCKGWAYLVMSTFIKHFETPVKVVNQIYVSLLQAHQPELKDLVKAALQELVPCLRKRVSETDFRKAMEQTGQLLLEEGNATPQLAHICSVFLHHPDVYKGIQHRVVSYMVASLHRLGIPQNSPLENRILAIDLASLLLDWDDDNPSTGKLTRDQLDVLGNLLVRLRILMSEPPDPRHKSDPAGSPASEKKLDSVLRRLLTRSSVSIRPLPIEKVILKDQICHGQLLACLELLHSIAASERLQFFTKHDSLTRDVLSLAVGKAKDSERMRQTLQRFFDTAATSDTVCHLAMMLFDKQLVDLMSAHEQRKKGSRTTDNDPPAANRQKDRNLNPEDSLANSFSIYILQAISRTCSERKSLIRIVASSLLGLGTSLTKAHLSETAAKQRQGSPSNARIVPPGRKCHTPTSGIIDEVLRRNRKSPVKTTNHKARGPNPRATHLSGTSRALVEILQILEHSELLYVFTAQRKALLQMIFNLLDASDCVQILIVALRFAGKCLLADSNGIPLTAKERASFVSKLTYLDYCGVANDLDAQPLADSLIVLVEKYRKFTDEKDLIKLQVSALMHSKPAVRKATWNWLSGGDVPTILLFWKCLHADFEALGSRFWITVLTDALLTSVSSSDVANSESLTALRVLIHGDPSVCFEIFVCLFASSWQQAPSNSARSKLAKSIEYLMSQPYHVQWLGGSGTSEDGRCSNSLRTFLNGILKIQPAPSIDLPLLLSTAESYSCWREVMIYLESQYACLKSGPLGEKYLSAMRSCCKNLEEDHIWMGLAKESCTLPQTFRVISKDVYDLVSDAVEGYEHLIELSEADDSLHSMSEFEESLWEERWLEMQKDLCQLGVVSEYASETKCPQLMLECAWKSQDWNRVRSLCSSSDLRLSVEAGDPLVKLSETLLAVADGKLSDVENLHAQTAQLCLYKWQLLPRLSSGSSSHSALLHFFHRLVEIRESGQIMVETNNHSSGRTLPDLKNLLNAWRHRLPNDADRMSAWDDVFAWREHMFTAITSNFHWSEPSSLATLHDRPWSVIRMAKTARKQGMRGVSLLLLHKTSEERAMNVADAFLKLREQILAYYNRDSETERHGGLNLINTTNLSFFDAFQKSELLRLKAQFFSSIGARSKANQAYCHSVQVCSAHGRAWNSWGELCSSLGAVAEKQSEQTIASAGGEARAQQEAKAASTKVAQYLAQAMGCYLEAVRIDGHEWARVHIPKCLWMLSKDSSPNSILIQTLEERGTSIPAWVWLPWIPQLLSSFYRLEGRAIKSIFSELVRCYPQAVYYPLRSFYLERRDVERARSASSGSQSQQMASVAIAEVMMSLLRRSHASLWSALESVLEELIVKFRPSYEEELLSTLVALLERAESQVGSTSKTSGEQGVTAPVWKTLSRIAVKFFRPVDQSAAKQDERAKKTALFKAKYKEAFEKDFDVKPDGDPSVPAEGKPSFTLEELLDRLRSWKEKLEQYVLSLPESISLLDTSQSLAMFGSGDSPDLWPGSCDPHYEGFLRGTDDSKEEDGTQGSSSTSSSAGAARKAACTAARSTTLEAMKEGKGGEYGGGSSCIEIPGQYAPNSWSWLDMRPSPELHAKIVKFDRQVEILRRNDQLVRRIGILASNGKTYKFLLQFAVPYWTRTDERTTQINYLLDKILRKDWRSVRSHLSIQPQPVIPVAQRLRLIWEPSGRVSLDEVYRKHCLKRKIEPSHLTEKASNEMKEWISGFTKPDDEKARKEAEDQAKLKIFRKVSVHCHPNILMDFLLETVKSPESLFEFRRTFAQQWAVNCLLQYVFSVAERSPSRVAFVTQSGRVLSPDFRVAYSSQGFMETPQIPFRLTPNLMHVIGLTFFESVFVPSICRLAASVRSNRPDIDPTLRLLMRDDLVTFYTKSMAKSDSQTQDMEKQLVDRVSRNVSTIHSRFSECCPTHGLNSDNGTTDPVDQRVRRLIKIAESDDALSRMPLGFQGWL